MEQVSSTDRAFLISHTDLDVFKEFSKNICFEAHGVFAVGTEYGNILEQLIDRYAIDVINAEQYEQRLERIAWKLEMEEQ